MRKSIILQRREKSERESTYNGESYFLSAKAVARGSVRSKHRAEVLAQARCNSSLNNKSKNLSLFFYFIFPTTNFET